MKSSVNKSYPSENKDFGLRLINKMCTSGERPNLMLAQVQVFGPGPGQDLSGTGPRPDLGPGMGPGPELDN